MRDQACGHFGRKAASKQSLKGLSVLDVGCGGGLLAEPMARLGAQVTAIDASDETIDIARHHAKASHLYVHPPVKGAARDEYRSGFTAGYEAAVKHSNPGV